MRVDKKVSFGSRMFLWDHLGEIRAFGEAVAEGLVTHDNPLETESKQSPFSTYHYLPTLPYWATIKIYYPVLYSQTSTKLWNHLVNKESLVSEWHLGRGRVARYKGELSGYSLPRHFTAISPVIKRGRGASELDSWGAGERDWGEQPVRWEGQVIKCKCALRAPSTLHTLSYLMSIKHYDTCTHILILWLRE